MSGRTLLPTLMFWLAACAPETADKPDDKPVDTDTDERPDTDDTSETGGPDETDPPADADGDGFAAPEDCDDTNPAVHPGADEACDGVDQDCDGTEDDAADAQTWYLDDDGDGFGGVVTRVACAPPAGHVETDGDCDDARTEVYPFAVETCDGTDEDCDGEVDEDAAGTATWYADADGDGLGDAGVSQSACAAPPGFVADATDCDDADATVGAPGAWYADGDVDGFGDAVTSACEPPEGHVDTDGDCDDVDATVHPGADETCDDPTDRNCDGSVGVADADGDGAIACEDCDDGDAGWSVPSTWYWDGDDDAFGDAAVTTLSCLPAAGWVADATDCDDSDGAVYPGAPETWYDDVDQGCDGGSDWDADGDGYDADADDCLDTDASVHPGAVEVCSNGLDDDCDGDASSCVPTGSQTLADAALALIGEGEGHDAGFGITSLPDPWGLGRNALVVGAEGYVRASGAAYVIDAPTAYGAVAGATVSLADAQAKWTGEAWGDHAGTAVAGGGDFDGDGEPDVLIGAYLESAAAPGAGATYVVPASATGTASLATASAKILGEADLDGSGWGLLALGDVDGNGVDDFVVNAPVADTDVSNAGATYVMYGPVSGTVSLSTAEAKLIGEAYDERTGTALASADLTGDGLPALLVGCDSCRGGAVRSGVVYAVQLPVSGTLALSAADFRIEGQRGGANFGRSVGAAGDVDGDGYQDIVVGEIANDTYGGGCGATYLFRGPLTGDLAPADAEATVYGNEYWDWLGMSVTGAGDVDLDGFDDVVMGAPDGTSTDEGRAGLFYGPYTGTLILDDADLLLYGTRAYDYAGYTVHGAGDATGDGYPDLLIGAFFYSDAYSYQGAAYLWEGGGF